MRHKTKEAAELRRPLHLEAERGGFDVGRVPSLGRQRFYDRKSKQASEIRLVILDHP
jgi:hypothetical protein